MATTEEVSPSQQSTLPATGTMEEELQHLTSQFKGQCKVIDSCGQFVKTVKLHPENLDIVFNFKLKETYPTIPPVVEVRSESLEEDEIFDLQSFLSQRSEEVRTHKLETMVIEALEWLKEGHIDVSGTKKKNEATEGKKTRMTRQKKNKHKDPADKGKKPPMKTAMDVVKRIMWDDALERDQFLVGYLDRLEGLKEKYFNAFSWENIASVDYTVLAIPKHRIQYFKYKDVIVWDKRCRLDNVFGSTGSKTTVKDVIAKVDGTDAGTSDRGGSNVENEVDARHAFENEAHEDSDYYDSGDFSDTDSDDSDDGITVTVGNTSGGAVGNTHDSEFDVIDDENGDEFDKYWRDKLRPNYFVALRITDESIRSTAVEIQKQVVDSEARLKDCKIPPGAMHLTLCTVGLESPEQVQNAVECLREAVSELKGIVPKDKKLTFKGVQNFFNRVIYGRVIDCPPEFFEFTEHLRTCLSSSGIEIRDYHEFIPHMTIMKVSRPIAKMTGNNYIAPWLYSSFNNTELGSQVVDNIHLCEMVDQRQEDGFYMTAASFDL